MSTNLITSYKHTYPALPLRNMVVFPGNTSSLMVGRLRSIQATQMAMDTDRKLVLFAQKDVNVVDPVQEDLFEIGVLVEVLQLLRMPDETFKVLLEGNQRIHLIGLSLKDNYYEAHFKELPSIFPNDRSKESILLKDLVTKKYR